MSRKQDKSEPLVSVWLTGYREMASFCKEGSEVGCDGAF